MAREVFLVTAFAVLVLSQAFVIPEEDLLCSTDEDCTMVANWGDCCAPAHYSPVNVKTSSHYSDLYTAYYQANCTNPAFPCAPLACDPLPVICNKTASSQKGLCAFGFPPALDPCPDDAPRVECLVDPCSHAHCAALPNAICVPDYCGGCKAKFYVDDVEALCDPIQAPQAPECPDGSAPVACFVDPCLNRVCPGHPTAQCVANNCGGCNFDFFIGEKKVDCEAECSALSCMECLAKDSCSYCTASYTVSPGDKESSVTDTVGICISSTGHPAQLCTSPMMDGSLLTSAEKCPALSGTGSNLKTEMKDPAPFQNDIESSSLPVASKFFISVALVVKEWATKSQGSNVVKLFVTLDGPGTLTPQDKEDLCAIVKDTLVKLEADVSRSNINCSLNEKLSLKRDASYVASLTYPASTSPAEESSSSFNSIIISFLAVVAAAALIFL